MPELFKEGILNMSTTPLLPAGAAQPWGEFLLNRIAVVVTVTLILIEIADLLRVFPQLFRCLSRWKGNMEVEHNMSVARTRNTVALPSVLIISMLADYYRLINPSFIALVPPAWSLAVTIGIVFGALFVRWLFYLCTPLRSRTSEFAITLRNVIFNYLILLSVDARELADHDGRKSAPCCRQGRFAGRMRRVLPAPPSPHQSNFIISVW